MPIDAPYADAKSLLVQAQHWLSDAARSAPPGTRTRGQSYRSAFLVSFADRIGKRLCAITDAVFAGAADDDSAVFLPVLRSRSDAVDDYLAERFGQLTEGSVRGGYDSFGWASGRLAADNAQLSFSDLEAAHS